MSRLSDEPYLTFWYESSGEDDHIGVRMPNVRVLVGTKKGAFVITSDGARHDWKINGPYFGGWEVIHVQGSPANPDRLYASQWTDWHGQVIQRSDDGGRSWEAVGNEFTYGGVTGMHQWYDGTPTPVGIQAGLALKTLS